MFGAKDISNFKDRLKNYEKVRKSSSKGNPHLNKRKDNVEKKESEITKAKAIHCYNCGGTGHMSEDCKHKEKGRRCFKCNNFGHIAPNCKEKKESDKSSPEAGVNFVGVVETNDCYKKVTVGDIDL